MSENGEVRRLRQSGGVVAVGAAIQGGQAEQAQSENSGQSNQNGNKGDQEVTDVDFEEVK